MKIKNVFIPTPVKLRAYRCGVAARAVTSLPEHKCGLPTSVAVELAKEVGCQPGRSNFFL